MNVNTNLPFSIAFFGPNHEINILHVLTRADRARVMGEEVMRYFADTPGQEMVDESSGHLSRFRPTHCKIFQGFVRHGDILISFTDEKN